MFTRPCLMLCCLLVTVLAADKYTDKYDDINIKEILENRTLLRSYADCFIGKGKCTPEGKEVKKNLNDALETGCEKCTEKQENKAAEAIQYLIENELEIWKEITDVLDPKGIWRTKYEERARQRGINIPKNY